jgi:hypothetical protein
VPVVDYAIADSGSPAKEAASGLCEQEALLKQSSLKCAVVELACDGLANLPAAVRPDQGRPCTIGQKVTISGTIQDVARKWGAPLRRSTTARD